MSTENKKLQQLFKLSIVDIITQSTSMEEQLADTLKNSGSFLNFCCSSHNTQYYYFGRVYWRLINEGFHLSSEEKIQRIQVLRAWRPSNRATTSNKSCRIHCIKMVTSTEKCGGSASCMYQICCCMPAFIAESKPNRYCTENSSKLH